MSGWVFQPVVPAAAQLLSGGAPSPTGQIKYWDGAAWTAKPVKYWDGASWVTKPVKYWNGAAWTTTTY